MKRPISVFIIEDSALMRRELTRIIESDPGCRVAGSAPDSQEGLEKIARLNPDVVTLDINLPDMDGLTTLQHIMLISPKPCVMISAYTGANSIETFEALELGAIDFVKKPSGEISRNIDTAAAEICRKIKAAAAANLGVIQPRKKEMAGSKAVPGPHAQKVPAAAVVIGVSTGGPRTLMQIIPNLDERLGVPVIIVQHMPPKFTRSFAERMNKHSRLPVKEAREGEPVLNNTVYVAPGGFNLTLQKEHRRIVVRLASPPGDQFITPLIETTMDSMIPLFGKNLVGVILTGMGNDGLTGMTRLYEMGGETLAESRETAVIFGMPKEVIDAGVIKKTVPSHDMAAAIQASVTKIFRGMA